MFQFSPLGVFPTCGLPIWWRSTFNQFHWLDSWISKILPLLIGWPKYPGLHPDLVAGLRSIFRAESLPMLHIILLQVVKTITLSKTCDCLSPAHPGLGWVAFPKLPLWSIIIIPSLSHTVLYIFMDFYVHNIWTQYEQNSLFSNTSWHQWNKWKQYYFL